MFKSPFKWASTHLISKILTPFINELNTDQLDYSILQGSISLKNI